MAYVAPTTKAPGDPVTADDYNLLGDNAIDHETRISNVEVVNAKVPMYVGTFMGNNTFATLSKYAPYPVSANFTATSAKFTIDLVGTLTGTLEIDVKKVTGTLNPAGAVSIFTTKPSMNLATAVNYQTSSNFVFDVANKNFVAGDFFYLEITSMPTGGALGPVVLNFFGET